MGFSRQEYWSEMLCPPPRNLSKPGWIILCHQGLSCALGHVWQCPWPLPTKCQQHQQSGPLVMSRRCHASWGSDLPSMKNSCSIWVSSQIFWPLLSFIFLLSFPLGPHPASGFFHQVREPHSSLWPHPGGIEARSPDSLPAGKSGVATPFWALLSR